MGKIAPTLIANFIDSCPQGWEGTEGLSDIRAEIKALRDVAMAARHAHANYLRAWNVQPNRKQEILGRALARLEKVSR
jgi:hypothetical protein